MRDKLNLCVRVEELRSDERGSITLLAGMMVFLVTIFAIIAFDTNKAIYNRIIAQNAVDSAADTAAMWQARGCNLLQHLNNVHYDVNVLCYKGESIAFVACVAAAAALFIPGGEELNPIACVGCDFAPVINAGQGLFAKAVLDLQSGIAWMTPIVAFVAANDAAGASGADPIIAVVPDYLTSAAAKLSDSIPFLSGSSSSVGEVPDSVIKVFDSIPVYAWTLNNLDPLDPLAPLDLHVQKKDTPAGGNGFPWYYAKTIAQPLAYGAQFICEGFDYSLPDEWGWNDTYYYGNPGFATWIAGKKHQDELLNLGDLAWLNGGMKNSDYAQNVELASQVMYAGGATGNPGNFPPFQIPAYVAIASSQVEGNVVVSYLKPPDAHGKLIQVYLPSGSPVTDYWIFH